MLRHWLAFAASAALGSRGVLPSPPAAQVRVTSARPSSRDSTYSSQALSTLVGCAAVQNQMPPAELAGYRARIESELSLIIRDTLGREQTGEVEQFATNARWSRTGDYDLHMVGYRAQTAGVPYSSLSFVRAWSVPVLYGDRLNLGVYFRDTRRTRFLRGDSVVAVHPFAADRDRYYRFSGGDTVTVLHTAGRTFPVVRVLAHPHFLGPEPFTAFDGEIDLDAPRCQIVRMRGQFVTLRKAASGRGALMHRPGITAVAFVEFVNQEIGGRYWLPSFQRTEFQGSIALLGPMRAVFRVVSNFSDYSISADSLAADGGDSTSRLRVVATTAPRDSLDAFDVWNQKIGIATSSVHADDFLDVAPDAWNPSGPPRFDFWPHGPDDLFRFNRIEGLYLGTSATLYLRDAMPGARVGAFAGYATAEHTLRGGVRGALQRLPWMATARVDRELPSTNDFTPALGHDPGLAALIASIDDADYLDRRIAAASLTRVFGSVDRGLITGEIAAARDAPEQQRIERGLFLASGAGFRPNRNVLPGSYGRASMDLEIHPNVSGESLNGGVGGVVHLEAAAGQLQWQRAELRLSARQTWGPVVLAAHADGGGVWSSAIPPQELFELGGNQTLPAYDYKQFVGDRAALFRTFVSYRLPVLRRPVHVVRSLFVPGPSPGFAVGIQGGWTQLSSSAARTAAAELSPIGGPPILVTATGPVRSSLSVGFTLFSEAVHLAVARPLDHPAPWRVVAGFGAAF